MRPIVALLLLLALLGVGLALGNQIQRAQQLEDRVAFLGAELGRAHDDLVAREKQMEGVRGAVSDLTQRMSALQTLVNQDPAADSPR